MKLKIISVGHKMPSWVETACAEYIKRMPRELIVEIIEIKPDKRSDGKKNPAVQAAEAERILKAVSKDYLIACDEHGKEKTTVDLAGMMQSWQEMGRDVSIVVGGADGLDPSLIQKASFCWSLSKLTMPHAFVRVLLAEQLYRAYTVIHNHPYHRE
ncbi:MAG: 23S rRNA (pseudouridine(1915)-N(3))-methyltransferase RlmH [Methylophilaceae bacterium]|jgi:23S rRNA (pseudouridine1915-N3)-methyltransferase|nr:23S rRNA (pseudouridine(1915)-N(3))-methyltransferase RlmH [Methylophilaceae bacterium]MDG1454028.1 23S rRNA (pseudouridine(1915)-N(3))-methyltransferase RlmH [Methylophilaceae bacterium]